MQQQLRHIFFAILLLWAKSHTAQAFDDDARLWINTSFSTKLSPKLEGEIMLQNRLNNNFTQYSGYSTFSLTYKLNKHLRFTGGYVLGARHELDGNYSPIQQLYGGFTALKNFRNFNLSFRSLIQSQQRGFSTSDYGSSLRLFSRNKLSFKYVYSRRIAAVLATEIYFTLIDNGKYAPIARNRLQLGLDYKITRKFSVEPYFLYQRNYELQGQATRGFIYGINLQKQF